MTPRTKTPSTDTGRMSFATAEALLWGPELRKQHEWLLGEMRALQTQHEAYDTRIQTNEAAVEAAEAATSRIRNIEQQITAMETVDDDKAFEKWATEEITRLGIFADGNESIHQKQIDLEKEVSAVVDEIGKIKDVPTDLGSVLRRLEILESGRKQDANQIKALEREIACLKSMPRNLSNPGTGANTNQNTSFGRQGTPTRVQDVEDSDTETEDEGRLIPRPINKEVQVPRSPEAGQNTSDFEFVPSLTRVQPAVSARLRLLKRPSIHNSKLPKVQKGIPPTVLPQPQTLNTVNPQAAQLVYRAGPLKRKQLDDEPCTARVTRSQIKAQESSLKQPEFPRTSKITSVESTQMVSRSPIKQTKPKVVPVAGKKAPTEPTQLVASSPRKRKKLIVVLPQLPVVRDGGSEGLQLNAADRVKTSPRKAAVTSAYKSRTRLSCNACHRLRAKCDRGRPSCGQCVKRSQQNQCQYVQSFLDETQAVSTLPPSPSKKSVQANVPAISSRSGAMSGADQDNPQLSVRGMSPEKPVEFRRSLRRAGLPSVADQTTTIGSARRVVPEITDYNTYLKMKADRTIL